MNANDYKKILIVGNGAREHAIGWKIKQDHPSCELFFAPGNAGTEQIGKNIVAESNYGLMLFAQQNDIDLTIVGPEAELVEGIVDLFESNQLRIFGPDKRAAKLEGSKAFAKDFMEKYGVRTAFAKSFNNFVDARDYVKELTQFPIVIKASGLAAGKGVIIVHDNFEAETTLRKIMEDKTFGEAGNEVVIEEYLKGVEVSVLSIFNHKEIKTFLPVKDHKKIGKGETGLNTGGMGVVAPNPHFTDEHMKEFEKNILLPTQKGLLAEKMHFAGIIFFGLMITEHGIYLLEYNMRFGDPETEALLPLMENDLVALIDSAIHQQDIELKWKNEHACCVVMASGGYPGTYETGFEIRGLNKVDVPVFIAGAREESGKIYTTGGRVLNVVGTGATLEEARKVAYENIHKINFDYEYYREDIGKI
ncbi:phosphoribosylamine--glycine ligase [Ornithobacterium rhinotracheale]|uniref:Phosphoribosylamine--glycine ligase n=1 Tax=Ornithobacterium rhinotracheale (strain ATCC 51463 / DSM 15997 / CCUG 23171 / CIP 104009 / LMG 9086) TaxID=867902 RepID=I3ZYU6_ORNRL|nr:phosphoribosylamine--glycine ligase [Ornithobacterium rhinotracheale]AFL96880.1 phosphoribosylamine--glycine ligase [Ornithobacterium rhinotracheale DSM 15997]AIP99047.1 phosphoribosylamine--glycine ligase [Ornithobacterium rhinotracheale ORT-UMN 88]KGB66968.1 phosphoribosylamine--glycine ligase [Ornithobacterium rhinotracheale H06-030791]MCK0194591.1 phosphoribosylamine--glycine ligase [Ornithobacterium rhinotracheale]UOH64696.1 phosphoribosylamine--glycine ligase [Ornithobacterium rhinotr